MSPGSTYTEEFPATPDAVPDARDAAADFALSAGAVGEQLDDIRLATSEAATNVVLHAYELPGGTFQVSLSHLSDELWLLVTDDGVGLRPGTAGSGLGLGLAVIAQLADELQIRRRSSGGTQLQMCFRLQAGDLPPDPRPRDRTLSRV